MDAYADHILSDEELADLTGYERSGDQIRWLARNGVQYTLRRDGKPRTTCAAYYRALSGAATATTPNYEAI